jgi:hypothetical protein
MCRESLKLPYAGWLPHERVSRPMAQMKPAGSLAIAATTVGFLPRTIMERQRLQSLVCASQAMSRMFLGSRTSISAFSFAIRAEYW